VLDSTFIWSAGGGDDDEVGVLERVEVVPSVSTRVGLVDAGELRFGVGVVRLLVLPSDIPLPSCSCVRRCRATETPVVGARASASGSGSAWPPVLVWRWDGYRARMILADHHLPSDACSVIPKRNAGWPNVHFQFFTGRRSISQLLELRVVLLPRRGSETLSAVTTSRLSGDVAPVPAARGHANA
jgi:hypothetical protein